MAIAVLLFAALIAVSAMPPAQREERPASTFLALIRARQRVLSSYLVNVERDLRIQSTNAELAGAIGEFAAAWRASARGGAGWFGHASGATNARQAAFDTSAYARVHARYHRRLTRYLRMHGYANVLLIDRAGNVVYSARESAEFATNVAGPRKGSDLGAAFRLASANPRPGFHAFFDFKAGVAGGGAPAATMAAPVTRDDGEPAGVLAVRIPPESMNDTMTDIAGRTFMVGRCSQAAPLSVCAWRP